MRRAGTRDGSTWGDMMRRTGFRLFLTIAAFSLLVRLVPYVVTDPEAMTFPWNFSPFPAACLFGAAVLCDRRWAYAVPMAAWLLGDLGIWAVTGHPEWAFYGPGQALVYAGYLLVITMGLPLRAHRRWWTIGLTGAAASVVFFVVSNFGVWAFGEGSVHPLTWEGLMGCYEAGLPFFRRFLAGTLAYSAAFFGLYALAVREPAAESLTA